MATIDTIIHNGRECVVLDVSSYQDLVDARDHADAMREIGAGAPTIRQADMAA